MAGAGYKLFNTGDVLTAAQVNTYLQEQSVMVFANAAARTTALSGVLAEGMISYLKDTDAVEKYNGTSWIAMQPGDIEGVTASSPLTGGGTSGTVTIGIQDASTSQKGAVQLSDSITTTSSTLAATSTAVKAVADASNNLTMVQQYTATESVLKNIPSRVPAAEQLLKQAVYWIDAAQSDNSDQVLDNQGWGAPALTTQLGSSTGVDSNDPKFLDFDGTNYVYTSGVTGNFLSVPDAANLRITGDIDIRYYGALDDWTPAARRTLVSKSEGTDGSYRLNVESSGILSFWVTDSSNNLQYADSTVAPTIADGAPLWIRATLDVDNGASGKDWKFFTSTDGTTWTQLGTTVTQAGTMTNRTNTIELKINQLQSGSADVTPGKIFRAQIFNGIDGTKVLDVNTSVITAGSATSFSALTGQTVTINRSTSGKKTAVVTHPVWLLGTDDYMEVADNAFLDFNATDSFTVLAVIRQWATPSSGRVINKAANSGTFDGYLIRNSGTSSAEEAYLTSSVSGTAGPITSNAYTLGQPFVTALVVNRSTQVANMVTNNSFSANTSISSVGTLENSYPLRIGNVSTGSNQYGDFELIAAAVFRRVLTTDEFTTITNYYTARIGA